MGRRTLLLWGHIGIALSHAAVAICDIEQMDYAVLGFIMVFIVNYSLTSGSIAWVYSSETTIETAFGACLLTLWGTVLILSIVCPILLDPKSLGASNVFFIFSGLSVLATLYVYIFMKETKGLSDKDKKLLYTPKTFMSDNENSEKR